MTVNLIQGYRTDLVLIIILFLNIWREFNVFNAILKKKITVHFIGGTFGSFFYLNHKRLLFMFFNFSNLYDVLLIIVVLILFSVFLGGDALQDLKPMRRLSLSIISEIPKVYNG